MATAMMAVAGVVCDSVVMVVVISAPFWLVSVVGIAVVAATMVATTVMVWVVVVVMTTAIVGIASIGNDGHWQLWWW